ncbi:CrcB family protein [Janibacter cremeus]|uniref:Fluoride-specific ion channel FluC n=1 Tax=Janibacter cremeus TaxID=1285192 RepID=A0A852VRW0_9MICO|nr:CrcB protein [Janibacter cremeus]
MTWLFVSIGGALGALGRHEVTTAARRRGATASGATMLVNLPGSLLLGLVAGVVTSGGPDWLLPLLGVGFCGGFTTFASHALHITAAVREQRVGHAVTDLVVSLVLGVALASLGWWLTT